MTLYALSGSVGVREDSFALDGGTPGEYHFAGATLTGGKWHPNQIFWNQYYAMTHNQGIGVLEYRVAFVENGREKFVANVGPLGKNLARYNRFAAWAMAEMLLATDPLEWSNWHNILTDLERGHLQGDVQKILSVMHEWAKASYETLLWVEKTMRGQVDPQDKAEIFVAHHQWLWHNITRETITIGYGKNIWGSTPFSSGGEVLVRSALPVRNGWFVTVSHCDKYLLSWNGHNVEARAFVFPYGAWEKHDKWMLWKYDAAVLTPQNQLVTFPAGFEFDGKFWDWMVLVDWDLHTHQMLVGLQGELCELDLSEYEPRKIQVVLPVPRVFPGKRNMLILHSDDERQRILSMASIRPATNAVQKPCPLWQVVAASDLYPYPDCVVIKDGATDVFVVAIDMEKGKAHIEDQKIGLCFINEHKQFWCPSAPFGDSLLLPYADVYGVEKNNMAVVVSRQRHPGPKDVRAVVEVSDGQGYVRLDSGITMSGPLVPLPEGEFNLWAHLNFVLCSGRASTKR